MDWRDNCRRLIEHLDRPEALGRGQDWRMGLYALQEELREDLELSEEEPPSIPDGRMLKALRWALRIIFFHVKNKHFSADDFIFACMIAKYKLHGEAKHGPNNLRDLRGL